MILAIPPRVRKKKGWANKHPTRLVTPEGSADETYDIIMSHLTKLLIVNLGFWSSYLQDHFLRSHIFHASPRLFLGREIVTWFPMIYEGTFRYHGNLELTCFSKSLTVFVRTAIFVREAAKCNSSNNNIKGLVRYCRTSRMVMQVKIGVNYFY